MKNEVLTSAFVRLRERLLSTAKGILSNDDEAAADALQDAFCKLWGRRAEITTEDSAGRLLTVTIRNTSIDMSRHKQTHPHVALTDDINPSADDDHSASDDLLQTVRAIIQRELSERERLILTLRDEQGWEYDEISASTGLSEQNVRTILSRARRKIRDIYNQRQ